MKNLDMVRCLTLFLCQLDSPVNLKLCTLHGHIINVIFSMGAAVFFHRKHISEFINEYFEDKNLLASSVYNHLNNPLFLAGSRAFGIIDNICTGPLWRIIENTSQILDLNDVWLDFKEKVEKYSSHASELLEGKMYITILSILMLFLRVWFL